MLLTIKAAQEKEIVHETQQTRSNKNLYIYLR